MPAGQKRHDAQAGDPRLAFLLGRERSVRLLLSGKKPQSLVDRFIQPMPLFRRKQEPHARRPRSWRGRQFAALLGRLLTLQPRDKQDQGQTRDNGRKDSAAKWCHTQSSCGTVARSSMRGWIPLCPERRFVQCQKSNGSYEFAGIRRNPPAMVLLDKSERRVLRALRGP
jgi:hypothetical protein